MGGGVDRAPAALPGVDITMTVAEHARFAAARAGQSIAESPVVVDVGQSSIKVVFDDVERSFDRPEGLDSRSGSREAFIGYVARAIRETLATAKPRAGILALPCILERDVRARAGTYPYPDGDDSLVSDIVVAAGLDTIPVFALNDAELAAYAAALDTRIPRSATTLVVTLGRYVGGAVLLKQT
jgi:predicted NBD/HSP70 family sugar kinase